MKDFLTKHLAFRYIGCVFIVLTLFMYGLGSYLHSYQLEEELLENKTQNTKTLSTVSLALQNWLDNQVKLAKVLANSQVVITACSNPNNVFLVKRAQKFLQQIYNQYGFYENIPLALHRPNGEALTVTVNGKERVVKDGGFFTDTVGGKTIGKCNANMSFIKASRAGKEYFISQVYPSLLRGNPIFVISVPVRNGNTHVGTLILAPQMDYFTNTFINKSRIGKTGHVFFSDDRNMIIAHNNPDLILKKDLGEHAGYLNRITKGENEFYSSAGTGEPYKYLSIPIDIPKENILHQWFLSTSQAKSEIESGADAFARYQAYACAVLIALLALIMYGLTRWLVTRPLGQIMEYSQKIEQGDLNATLHINRTDEIGAVASSLQNMTVHMIGQLQAEMGFMKGILNGIQNPFAVVDTDLKLINCSQSMVATSGQPGSVEDYKGVHLAEFLFKDPNKHVMVADVLEDKKPRHNMPFTYTNTAGKEYEFIIDVVAIFDDNGTLLGGITFWNDVTELKKQQAAIEAQKNRVEKAAATAEPLSLTAEGYVHDLTEEMTLTYQRTEQQKERLLETVTAIDELSTTIQEVARHATHTAQNAQETKENAQKGFTVVKESMDSIQTLKHFIADMQQDLHQLSEQADDIGNVMKIINDIADQTNLLALNAAIEAARAGDAGRGFSVVADEVRKLAEKTMAATGEVEGAISAIQTSSKQCTDSIAKVDEEATNSVNYAANTNETLKEITGLAETTNEMISEIATAAEQQSAATEQIAKAAGEVGVIAEETHQSMASSEKNVQQVERAVNQLHEIITGMQ
ncbi:MAG: methyl-accepting chemotaxis protein [Desulfovibrionales bacterium]|nr:methyl-accepting chemotaxis protein [Desulfovibrionales bacterium]